MHSHFCLGLKETHNKIIKKREYILFISFRLIRWTSAAFVMLTLMIAVIGYRDPLEHEVLDH